MILSRFCWEANLTGADQEKYLFIVEIPLPSVIHIHKIVWQISKGISSLKSSLCCEQVTAIYPEVRENQIIFFKIQFDFKSFRRPYMI